MPKDKKYSIFNIMIHTFWHIAQEWHHILYLK